MQAAKTTNLHCQTFWVKRMAAGVVTGAAFDAAATTKAPQLPHHATPHPPHTPFF